MVVLFGYVTAYNLMLHDSLHA